MHVYFMILCFLCIRVFAREPHCSKFSYDEALLEKMIRTEVKFEQLQAEFAELGRKVNNMLDTMTVTLKEIQKDRHVMKEDFSTLNESAKAMVDDFKEKQSERLSEEFRALYKGIRENLNATAGPVIAFKATDSRTGRSLTADSVLNFPTVLFNAGERYDPSDGKFTAPVKGLYLFTVQICTVKGFYFSGKIVVDETEVGRFDAGDDDFYHCDTGDAITQMDVGQKAYVKVLQTATTKSNTYTINSFSGALLHKTV